ncbi:MAG TPA: hypothetical protein VKS22_05630 [Candidatus Binataceae bacterium]|nr:hypothetical protein [Candidatus Binataceae bacterium]
MMIPRITIEIRKGMATVLTKKLRLPESHGLKAKPATIAVVIRDYDIEGGSPGENVVRRGYSREITEITVE